MNGLQEIQICTPIEYRHNNSKCFHFKIHRVHQGLIVNSEANNLIITYDRYSSTCLPINLFLRMVSHFDTIFHPRIWRKLEFRKKLSQHTLLCLDSIITTSGNMYNNSKISRANHFIIHLIRDHIVRAMESSENNLIMAAYYVGEEYISEALQKVYVP